MDDIARLAVFGGVVPLIVSAALIAPGRTTPENGRTRRAWRVPLGLALPVVAAFLILYGWPREQWQSMTWIPAAGLVVGVIMSCTPRVAWLRGLLLVLLAGACLGLLWPVLERETTWHKVGTAAGVAVLCLGLEPLAVRRPGPVVPVALLLATATASVIILTSGFMKLTIPIVGLGVALGICMITPIWRRGFGVGDGAVAVVAPVLVTGPIVAWLYMLSAGDPFPLACFILPAAAPLLAWVGEIGPLRRTPVAGAVVSLVLVAAICAAAVLLSLGGEEDDADDPMMQMYEEMMGQ